MESSTTRPVRGQAGLLLLGIMAVLVLALVTTNSAGAAIATPCIESAGTWTCELWATTGTLSLADGGVVPIWGYASASGAPAQIPGPALVFDQGEDVEIILHNDLAEHTSLFFPGLSTLNPMVPDLTGIAPGALGSYTFQATEPGTFLYEAGLTANGARQVAMGMYGGLIVRPAGAVGQAYADPDTAFDDEALLVFSEVDPALNNAPTTFSMFQWRPRYWLINGKAFPDTDPIPAVAGQTLLVRYLNAGLQHHSIGVLGLRQEIIAQDGMPLAYPYTVVAETIGSGEALDVLVRPSPATPDGARYPLGNLSLHQHNANQRLGSKLAYGGMLAFLTVSGVPVGGDTVGPTASGVAVAPSPTTGVAGVTLTANLSDVATGGGNVIAAEYFIGSVGVAGSGVAITGATFGSPTVAVSEFIPDTVLAGLPSGLHQIYLRGQDDSLNWGAVGSTTLNLDKAGPATSAVQLGPQATNTGVDVAVHATASDSASGGSDVVAAEYFLGVAGADGAGIGMAVNTVAPTTGLVGQIPLAEVQGLSEGAHAVYVHSQDALGNWGPFGTVNLEIDQTGPDTTGATADPSPNNGQIPFNPSTYAVRVMAHLVDPDVAGAQTNIASAEFFIDLNDPGQYGTGSAMTPSDGLFDSPTEDAWANIPLATVNALSEGEHTIYIHARDTAGNYGPMTPVSLVIDKTGPTVADVQILNGVSALSGLLTATATDSGASPVVAGAEWFLGADPGPGNGAPMAAADGAFDSATEALRADVDISGWPSGLRQTISVRARDAVGNWSPVAAQEVARYDQTLYETNGSDFNFIGLPVEPGLAMTSDLKAHIEANSSAAVTIGNVYEWSAVSQGYQRYRTVPTPAGDFAVAVTKAYRVSVDLPGVNTGSVVWTLVGNVPPQAAFTYTIVETSGSDYNWVLLPWTKDNLTQASHLRADIEADAIPDTAISRVQQWNGQSQGWQTFRVVPTQAGDFPISVGLPYRVTVDVAAPDTSSDWPW